MHDTPAAGQPALLRLRILLPTEILLDVAATRIVAEADNGAFCLLPRHIDFVAALVPGVLIYVTDASEERYVAVDRGVLVKCAGQVDVSTLNGACGSDLGQLRELVEERFVELDEHERRARAALARLEAGTLRGFRRLQEIGHD